MDALPVREATGLPYASTATGTDASGHETPVMHACGHDMHVTCLLAAAQLLAEHQQTWSGTLVALFQPAEELGTGARAMVGNGLADLIPKPDAALGQHVMGLPCVANSLSCTTAQPCSAARIMARSMVTSHALISCDPCAIHVR